MADLERGPHGLRQLRALQGGLLTPDGAHKLPRADVLDVAAVASEEGRAAARGEVDRGRGL